ncbi:MAG: flagellin [candidate division Zixibacteria bacterium]|nr:flagellin [candidate division Zixibacteria bacterium]MDH3938623.1 flagellin [candidate division Zixibacteria bacterium]MDH4032813.1 flagellin [candidate division Zixibacteria bacterium]
MGISINTNLATLSVARKTADSYSNLYMSMEKLTSGLKINRASDDPAGLVISEQFRAQIGSLNQEIENTSHLINKYETASSTVGEMRSQLTELRGLAVSAASEGFNDDTSQAALAQAGEYIVDNYNHTADSAVYNGTNMLDGSEGAPADVSKLENVDLSSAEAAEASIAVIDDAIAELDSVQIELGATQKYDLESRRSSLEITAQNLQAAESLHRDADYALEVATMVGEMIKVQSSLALMSHTRIQANSVLRMLGTK